MLPWKMNTNKQLITSVTGAITASQVEKLYSFSTSMVIAQQQNDSVVDNSINFLVYGLESGILYFWLNLLNGYMRIGVTTEDELVKGKTYLYNHEMPRSFDGIRQMMWAQQKNRQHVPLCQLKYDDESRALFVDTKNPMLYVQERGYNNTLLYCIKLLPQNYTNEKKLFTGNILCDRYDLPTEPVLGVCVGRTPFVRWA